MAEKTINRLVALGVFLFAFIIYFRTLSATVVFWDVGEFCAASWLLQVPHPPGSPLFVLLARIVSMVPFVADIARRMHSISTVAGALGAMFMYLNAVYLIKFFRGLPTTLADRITVYGGAAIGALAMAFSATFWDNSIEAEVYGLSMLFVSFMLWLAFKWSEHADEPHNERYILMMAYLIGLSIGVHLLTVLAIFTIMMVFYFRHYDYTRKNLIRLILIGVPVFFAIYPGVVQWMPSMLDGSFAGIDSELWPFMPLVLAVVALYFAWKSVKTRQKWVNIAALSFLFICLGYTTYIEVIIRANVHPPMNENNPSTLVNFVKYIGREQYGDTKLLKGASWDNDLQDYREKLFPRRASQEEMHRPTRENYTSDGDFFWRYQIDHMFLRYLEQNYIGAAGDYQDAGVSWKETWGIPFLIGLFGFFWHVRKDWRNFLPIFVMFMVMGFAFAFYANMQEPQPRERDYFYVGAFYAFCLWIAIGVVGLIDLVKELSKNVKAYQFAAPSLVLLAFVGIPMSMLRMNYHENDRSGNFVAWDYSYNLLQSCDPDAILFTNGDNDTFPLWYLQDVEGIRTDVRIANLSLINTDWYIMQLKHERPHGAPEVPISLSDQEISRIEPGLWEPRTIDLPVSDDVLKQFNVTDSSVIKNHKVSFKANGVPYGERHILRVQDRMVLDIVQTNNWKRPIDFAVTCSPDSKVGLDNYLWMQGMVWRLEPIRTENTDEGGINAAMMEANVLNENTTPSKTPLPGFRYRGLNNPNQYYDENVTRMIGNYRASFLRLADNAFRNQKNAGKAKAIIDQMERVIPIDVIPNTDWRYTWRMMNDAHEIGATDHFNRYSKLLEDKARELLANPALDPRDGATMEQVLLQIYDFRSDYKSALDVLKRLQDMYPGDQSVKQRIDMYERLAQQNTPKDTAKHQ